MGASEQQHSATRQGTPQQITKPPSSYLASEYCTMDSPPNSPASTDEPIEDGKDEVRAIIEAWCDDIDSPFVDVPLLSDGGVDIPGVLVAAFDSVGVFPTFALNPFLDDFVTNARSNGGVVLLGLFHLHCKLALSFQRNRSSIGPIEASSIHSPTLARVFKRAAMGESTDIADAIKTDPFFNYKSCSNENWFESMKTAVAPFKHALLDRKYDHREILIPFDFDTTAPTLDAACVLGMYLLTHVPVANIPLGNRMYDLECPLLCDNLTAIPKFARYVQWQFSKCLSIDKSRFPIFCNALFKCIVRAVDGDHAGTPTWNDYRGVFQNLAGIGLKIGAIATMQFDHNAVLGVLRSNHVPRLNELPSDTLEYLLKNHLLNTTLNVYPKPTTRCPEQITSEESKKLYQEISPRHGQTITISKLHPYDSVLIPPYVEYIKKVFRDFANVSSAANLKADASRHQAALAMTSSDQQIGVRHMLKTIWTSNSTICTLRAVCKSYARLFRDFVFRPFVELEDANEPVGVHQTPALRGAIPREVRLTYRKQLLHVYFARKSITINRSTGDVAEHWQYLNPNVAAIGCNAISVTCETEADSSGRIVKFDAAQGDGVGTGVNFETVERSWSMNGEPFGYNYHRLQPESLKTESIYSMHTGSEWKRRMSQKDLGLLVCLWDHKFEHKFKRITNGSLHVAKSQSFTIAAKCPVTSESFCNNPRSASEPLRAIRFKVTIGNVARDADAPAAADDKIVPFTAAEMAKFSAVVSGCSNYFYTSNVSLSPEAVATRASKRKLRTASERANRESQLGFS